MARSRRNIVGSPFGRKTPPLKDLARNDLISNVRMALGEAVKGHKDPGLSVEVAKAHFLKGKSIDRIAKEKRIDRQGVEAILKDIETYFRKNSHKMI